MIWNLIFTFIPIIQYSIVNASLISYSYRCKEIANLFNELSAFSAKTEHPEIPEQLLNDSRKHIAKNVRATITGGDVLQIEDFQIDINAIKSKNEENN